MLEELLSYFVGLQPLNKQTVKSAKTGKKAVIRFLQLIVDEILNMTQLEMNKKLLKCQKKST